MHSEKLDDVVVASFDENISKFNALITEEAKKDITSLYAKSGTKLALNLDGIKYIDSTGFGVFLYSCLRDHDACFSHYLTFYQSIS